MNELFFNKICDEFRNDRGGFNRYNSEEVDIVSRLEEDESILCIHECDTVDCGPGYSSQSIVVFFFIDGCYDSFEFLCERY